ncbi:MAG: hypothetical protein J4F28_08900 [Nitrosopumilaceae archaeon]|nr:hypothetical protein [Nitrosopumilaceae archaeon]
MGTYYLDIETSGLDERASKIITVQYQALDRNSGAPAGPLVILKEWEHGEREVLRRFVENTDVSSGKGFDFVPVGYNLGFEHRFLSRRSEMHGLPTINIRDRPMMDLHTTGVIMNSCEFRGSGLDRMTGKAQNGSMVSRWYEDGDYGKITEYVEDEAREFLRFFAWLCKELPILHKRFASTIARP